LGTYGRYNRAALETMLRHVNLTLSEAGGRAVG